MHAPWLRVSLGSREEQLPLSVPQLVLHDRRQSLDRTAPRSLDRYETKINGTKLSLGGIQIQDKKA